MAIAIPSGTGVALSTLGNNTSSLVGVAISASLLPPAVNAGICWFYALLLYSNALEPVANPDRALDEQWTYENYLHNGTISLLLTVLNITCIWLAGFLMFTFKEVSPLTAKNTFWSRDVRAVRAINRQQKQYKGADARVLGEGLKAALEIQSAKSKNRSIRSKKGAGKGGMTGWKKAAKKLKLRHSNIFQQHNQQQQVPASIGVARSPMEGAFSSTASMIMRQNRGYHNYGAENYSTRLGFEDDSDGSEDGEEKKDGGGLDDGGGASGLMSLFQRPSATNVVGETITEESSVDDSVGDVELSETPIKEKPTTSSVRSTKEVSTSQRKKPKPNLKHIQDVRFFGLENMATLLFNEELDTSDEDEDELEGGGGHFRGGSQRFGGGGAFDGFDVDHDLVARTIRLA